MYYILLICLSVDGQLGCFHILSIMNNAIMDICVQIFVWMYVFISVGYIPRSGIAGSYGYAMINILRKYHAGFQSNCIILRSRYQYTSLPLSPHPHQHFLLPMILIVAILVGVKEYLIVGLGFFSL
uniref:Uncharacterized protein n=1 Tax=Equus caballus TaxID=9796 RepID=A0A9L0RZR5_HORSE